LFLNLIYTKCEYKRKKERNGAIFIPKNEKNVLELHKNWAYGIKACNFTSELLCIKKRFSIMTKSLNIKSAALIRRIIDFHQEKSQAISLTKLYQLMYLIDFGHYALHGEVVSHFEYLRHGSELIPIGAAEYIQLAESKTTNTVSEPAVTYATANTLSDTALEVIEKTLTRLCEVSEAEIRRIIGYHHTWHFPSDDKILKLDKAVVCDFEWLDYFSHERTREDYEEDEALRRSLENNEKINEIMRRIQKIKI